MVAGHNQSISRTVESVVSLRSTPFSTAGYLSVNPLKKSIKVSNNEVWYEYKIDA